MFRCGHHRGLFALHKTNKQNKIKKTESWREGYIIVKGVCNVGGLVGN